MATEEYCITTIKDFLIGCAGGYPIEQTTLQFIAVKRNVVLEEDVAILVPAERDGLEIEMLRFLLRSPMMTASVEDKNGTWMHKDGAVELNSTDKKYIQKRLKELEAKYGISTSSIKMHNKGMKIWH